MAKIGYIGLGIMGAAIARNLMKAGHELVVHNRSQEIVQQLVSEGATAAHSPKEVAQQVEFVFTNLPELARCRKSSTRKRWALSKARTRG